MIVKMKKKFALAVLTGLFLALLPIQLFSATVARSEGNTLAPHKLAMSIAFLKERVLTTNPEISDERCLREIHSMLHSLGFDVSLDNVEKIGRAERKVSNTVSDIQVKELEPLSFAKNKRPVELVADRSFVASTLKELSDKRSQLAVSSSKKRHSCASTVRRNSHSLRADVALKDILSFLLSTVDRQLTLTGRVRVCSRNHLVLNSLYGMGLPEVDLGDNWERYTPSEFLTAIRQNVSKASIEEFEENAVIFIHPL